MPHTTETGTLLLADLKTMDGGGVGCDIIGYHSRERSIAMSTTTLLPSSVRTERVPPLENGDYLTRQEFERRYEAMAHLKKAELLRGVVYMPSPLRLDQHGHPHFELVGWAFLYEAATSGIVGADNSTIRLGPEDEPQPDVLLMIPRELGGQAAIDADGFVDGAPELAIEVAASSVSYDLHVKLEVYQERGVREYVVWRTQDRAIDWFVLRGGVYERLEPRPDGILRSEVFPGLWLEPSA
ncbi:MAG TPA: Uma2 family endonuclease, partial [Armatimonadota bacterium]|nr:Uma2 family endonuclease [Armatimonadota bacterium]